jgi:Tol biopolymer transport system component
VVSGFAVTAVIVLVVSALIISKGHPFAEPREPVVQTDAPKMPTKAPAASSPTNVGKIVFTVLNEQKNSNPPEEEYVMDSDGTNVRPFTTGWGDFRSPLISLDRQKILNQKTTIEGDVNSVEIFIRNVDGTEEKRLTNDSNNDSSPIWSPDNKYIYFTSQRNGHFAVFRMSPDGSNQEQLTRSDIDNGLLTCGLPPWSPTDGRIALVSFRDGNSEIYAMNPDGSEQTRLTNGPATEFCPAWSPDGKRIAFVSLAGKAGNDWASSINGNFNGDVYVMDADGSNVTRLTNGEHVYWPRGLVWLP